MVTKQSKAPKAIKLLIKEFAEYYEGEATFDEETLVINFVSMIEWELNLRYEEVCDYIEETLDNQNYFDTPGAITHSQTITTIKVF